MTQPVALITGCSSGIGRALADAYGNAGYSVWATARKAADLEALSAAGFNAVELDVNDASAIAQLAARLETQAQKVAALETLAAYNMESLHVYVLKQLA